MKGSLSIGSLLMNVAIALYLIATGIMGFTKEKGLKGFFTADPEIRKAIEAIFTGRNLRDFNEVLIAIISVLAIAAGVFILMRLFDVSFPSIDLILIILCVVWVAFIIMIDFFAPIKSDSKFDFIPWVRSFAPHLMVLAGLISATGKFG